MRHFAQTDADRQRRITESYSKAVEQLASDKIEKAKMTRPLFDGRPFGDRHTGSCEKTIGGLHHYSQLRLMTSFSFADAFLTGSVFPQL